MSTSGGGSGGGGKTSNGGLTLTAVRIGGDSSGSSTTDTDALETELSFIALLTASCKKKLWFRDMSFRFGAYLMKQSIMLNVRMCKNKRALVR